MGNEIVERLLGSLEILGNAIHGAKNALMRRSSISPEVLSRIDSYDAILNKQREIVKSMNQAVDDMDWASVGQKVQLINGLLEMIRQDAGEVLRDLQGDTEEDDDQSLDLRMC